MLKLVNIMSCIVIKKKLPDFERTKCSVDDAPYNLIKIIALFIYQVIKCIYIIFAQTNNNSKI